MLGPSSSRNLATSVSRLAADSSSWKTPLASCALALSASRSISSVSRWATNTSVFSFARRQRFASVNSHWRRGSVRSIASACCRSPASSGPSTAFSAAPDASARRIRSRLFRRATRSDVSASSRSCATTSLRPPSSSGLRSAKRGRGGGRSIATGARGGSPPISTRRVELVHGGRGTPDPSRASTFMPSGNSSGRSSCSSRKNPCTSSSSGVALSSRTCRPSAASGAIARYAGPPG